MSASLAAGSQPNSGLFLESVLDALPASLYIVDRELRVVAWNGLREEGPRGISRSRALGRLLRDVLPPEGMAVAEPAITSVFDTGRGHEDVKEVQHEAGSSIYRIRRLPVRQDQETTHVLSVFEDITERDRAERALRESQELTKASEERYRMLFEDNPQPMWVYDVETLGFLAVNDAALRHYGYSRVEFLTMTIEDIHPEAEHEKLRAVAVAAPGIERAGVWRHRRKDGTLIDVEVSSHAVPFGEWQACLVLANDVTERKCLEEQLRQSQKMEAVGRLAGGIAHDFNNMLSVIMGYASMLLKRVPAGDVSGKPAREVLKAAERAASLTRQLLAFSRKQALDPKVVNLNELVTDTARMLHRLLGEDIELDVVTVPDLGRTKVDPGQMEQVLMNLAVNARDAMPDGGRLTVETANVDLDANYARRHMVALEPGRYVMLAVTDTGIGMDAETRGHIFEPFFTTKDKDKGTGLGLATVYGIVKQSGGHIRVNSEPGRGTTFKVYLPRTDEVPQPEHTVTQATVARGSETVLLVEDEEMLRVLIREDLESWGYGVLEASHGAEALRIAGRHDGAIHLIVTDVIMPDMNGPELARRIRVQRPDIKVLCFSGFTDDVLARLLDPDVPFLRKPFAPDAFARKVRHLLDRRPETAAVRRPAGASGAAAAGAA